MSTNFPTSLDTLTNPTATDSVAVVDHAAQHSNANDSIEALEAKVGVNSSAVTTTHDYKLSLITGSDKAVPNNSPTIVTPTIASFANANHNHTNSAGGGQLTDAALSTAVTVPKGGTGVGTFTDGGVLVGNGTGAVQATSAGTVGHVLTSNGAGVDPTFQALSGAASCLTSIPSSTIPQDGTAPVQRTLSSNTTAYVGQIIIPIAITANKVSVRTGDTVNTAGTLDLTLYTENGQTQIFSVTTASMAATATMYSTALSAVAISAGVYYFMVNTNSTTSLNMHTHGQATVPFSQTVGIPYDVASEPIIQGSLTITAGTPPATFDPTAITELINSTIIFRLDN